MEFQVLAVLLILACLNLTTAQGSYDDCCLGYSNEIKEKLKHRVVDYTKQEADGGCNIVAIVFTFKRGRRFCGNTQEPWVQKLMKKVDKAKEKPSCCKKTHMRRAKACHCPGGT